MKIAIVYDSSTGNTKSVAEQMASRVHEAGHDCLVESITQADPAEVAAADAICIGSWTKGLYVVFQGPTRATLEFIAKLGRLDRKPAAVFASYAVAIGRTLPKMAAALEAQGATVSGQFRSKGSVIDDDFDVWLRALSDSTSRRS